MDTSACQHESVRPPLRGVCAGASPDPDSVGDDLVRLVYLRSGIRDFAFDAAKILTRAVPFDGVCLVAMVPASLLPTAEVVEGGLPPEAVARMAEIELQDPDVNKFVDLADARPPPPRR